ncbi:MAG TPA: TerB family tellurite resistance protein [Candidatus Hydrogenedentes bacterium]|nr:TerB family tellurite resistance protein [Candidatus Hydrogenedentota bacterium]
MLDRLRDLLISRTPSSENARLDPAQVATGVLLIEAASVDEDFTEVEKRLVRRVIRERFDLDSETVEAVIAEAKAAHSESFDLWQFTHELNESCTQAEKIAIMEDVWRVLYSDGHLGGHEDHLAHKLRHLLNLSHPQFIEAKMKILREVRSQ